MLHIPGWCRTASVALWLGAAATLTAAPATELMSKALNARAAGRTDEAVALLQQAIDTTTRAQQQSLARLMLGDTLLDMNQPARALAVFDELQGSPTAARAERSEAQYKKAQCQGMLGRWDAARETARNLIDGDPKSPYSELARAFLETSKPNGAAVVTPRVVPVARSEVPADVAATAVAPEPAVPQTSAPAPAPDPDPGSARSASPAVRLPREGRATTLETVRKAVADADIAKVNTREAARPVSGNRALTRLLTIPTAEGVAREEIATRILQATNHYELDPKGQGKDKVLLDIASLTAQFGEPVEACKRYDQLLRAHPQSAFIETAYFEAIRLRAILKVYGAAISWGETFLNLFPDSIHGEEVGLLIAHARAASDPTAGVPAGAATPAGQTGPIEPTATARPMPPVELPKIEKAQTVGKPVDTRGRTEKSAGPAPRADVAADARYRTAKKAIADGHYETALSQLQKLRDVFPKDPGVLWNLALVLVQQENYRGAAEVLEPLAQQQPNDAEVRSLLGYVHYQLKDLAKAEADYRQAGPTAKQGLAIYDPEYATRRVQQQADRAATRPAPRSASATTAGEKRPPTGANRAATPVSRRDRDAARDDTSAAPQ